MRYHDAGHLVGGLTAYYGSLTDDALISVGDTVVGGTAAGTQADAHTNQLASSHRSDPADLGQRNTRQAKAR